MRKRLTNILCAGIMAVAMVVSSIPVFAVAEGTANDTIIDSPLPFQDLDAETITKEMGMGINLGNTLDGHSNQIPGEMFWNDVLTTQEIVTCMHDLGYNTLRVPVTWGKMIKEDYSVNEEWMGRVQEVVDYAINENMYVILNIHHDDVVAQGGWLDISGSDEEFAEVEKKFKGVWQTIAERFKNYDEHLILESMNEVYGRSGDKVDDVNADLARINRLNQDFVDVVRDTGSNNAKRWLDVPTRNTQIKTMIEDQYDFQVPTDPAGRIMVAGHMYDSWSVNAFDETRANSYASQYKALKEKYYDNGIPVVIGEFGVLGGVIAKAHCEGAAFLAKKYNMIGCLWDIPGALVDRANLESRYKDRTDAMMRGYFYDEDAEQISKDTEVTALTDFSVDMDSVTLQPGDKQQIAVSGQAPADSNDVILWKSNNPRVASVYNGLIAARTAGTATITAFAQSGTVAKEITVRVDQLTLDTPSTGIETAVESLELEVGEGAFLNAVVQPAANGASLTYTSKDDKIATVSAVGRVLGKKKGTTSIVITTSDGFTKEIGVTVVSAPIPDSLDNLLAIHVYYNSAYSETKYGGMEYSIEDVIRVTGDGQYSLSFDCERDLSDAAKESGVTGLNGIGSLYITDLDVTLGTKTKSTTLDGKIIYNSIKLNGVEMLDGDTEAYPAVKSNVIDTNNPLNAWDGSVVTKGIVEHGTRYYLTFEQENPSRIDITFTLTGFTKPEVTPAPKPEESSDPSGSPSPGGSPSPDPGVVATPAPTASVTPSTQPEQKKPAQVKNVKVKAGGKKLTVSWKKQNGMKYKIAYSTSKAKLAKLKNGKVSAKGVKVVNAASAKANLKSLKPKKKYYVKVCAYTTLNDKKTYGKWSSVKMGKTK